MNAYLVDCFTDLKSPVHQFYLFAASFQEAIDRVAHRKDLIILKEIQIFQDPKTFQIPTLATFYFTLSTKDQTEHQVGVLAENVDIAFSLAVDSLDAKTKLTGFYLGEQRLAPFISA